MLDPRFPPRPNLAGRVNRRSWLMNAPSIRSWSDSTMTRCGRDGAAGASLTERVHPTRSNVASMSEESNQRQRMAIPEFFGVLEALFRRFPAGARLRQVWRRLWVTAFFSRIFEQRGERGKP